MKGYEGFSKLGVPYRGSPEQGLLYFGAYIGYHLLRETGNNHMDV